MKPISILFLTIFFNIGFAQNFKEKELKTEIKEVTIFLNGAQIFETGAIIIPSGKTIIQIKNLSSFLDEKTIQVKGEGDFTILSVNHKLNYLNELKRDSKIDSLKKIIEIVGFSILRENAHLEVLKEKLSLLNENKNLGGQNSGATIVQLKQAIDFYENEISKIKEDEIKTKKLIEDKNQEQKKLENQLKGLNSHNSFPSSEIEIRVNSDTQVNGKFQITYLVSNAGWYPKYDVRVKNIKSPLELTFKAEVYQNTGVDWKNIKIRFSNGNPNESGVLPELYTWNLNYARNTVFEKSKYESTVSIGNVKGCVVDESGTPLPGVNVLVKGTSIGTMTDLYGKYNLTIPNGAAQLVFKYIGMNTQEVPINRSEINVRLTGNDIQLSEVMMSNYAVQSRAAGVFSGKAGNLAKINTTTVFENQTTVEIEVEMPYSIRSNGEKLLVDLKKHSIEALYEYYAIPKLDKDVFLIARIINWDQYNLLEGEANLYFEDGYVGRSILDTKALHDTLNISLGRDKNIIIRRERDAQYSLNRSIGSNIHETRSFKIITRNKKSNSIKLTIFDQIPVSVISDIIVTPLELSKGQLDDKTGKVTWELSVEPQQQIEVNLQYEVKYPKKEKVILE